MLYTLPKNKGAAPVIEAAASDLRRIIVHRIQSHFNGSRFSFDRWTEETFGDSLIKKELARMFPSTLSRCEWTVLMLALVPHADPAFFTNIMTECLPAGGDFPEFGGVKGVNHRGLLPTGETAQFLIGGDEWEERGAVQRLFDESHFFYQSDIVGLEAVREGEPVMSGRLIMTAEWVNRLLTGREQKPKFSADFPAKLTTTRMTWDDLVLHPYTADQIDDIKRWVKYHHVVEADDNLSRKISAGYRVLLHGPAGTGKTLTAALIGKEFDKDVYRIDLSQIVSKYIGETEKNLGKIFDRAQHKNWILFFDEADALFGKRTSVQSSHDKYANQEVSFLLQRIEEFSGLMILASNFKANIDEAFLRRFHAIIHFPIPNAQERLKLWQQSLPVSIPCSADIDLRQLAMGYEISGASIVNAVQYASLRASSRHAPLLEQVDLVNGIRKELLKEEKSF